MAGPRSRVLVLGSMPGAASLAKKQYYGLAQNTFWKIMGDLFGAGPDLSYAERLTALTEHGIALWDVLESCFREGSLDSAIQLSTARTNDFENLFRGHAEISHVFFNGKKAAELFEKRVLPKISDRWSSKIYAALPSTSPAHASMTYEKKLECWTAVKTALVSGKRREICDAASGPLEHARG